MSQPRRAHLRVLLALAAAALLCTRAAGCSRRRPPPARAARSTTSRSSCSAPAARSAEPEDWSAEAGARTIAGCGSRRGLGADRALRGGAAELRLAADRAREPPACQRHLRAGGARRLVADRQRLGYARRLHAAALGHQRAGPERQRVSRARAVPAPRAVAHLCHARSPPAGLGAGADTPFTLNESRRVRFYERNYFDHPAFGVIALVTPAQGARPPGR